MSDETFIASALLGSDRLVAGFSTRAGGEDEAALARRAGIDRASLFTVTQVHGARVVEVGPGAAPASVGRERADALVTSEVGPTLAVRTADCVPVLIADPAGSAVGAAHAGWRGLVAGVLGATVAAVARLGRCRPADLVASIGPAIGPCCFEVGEEVAAAITEATGAGEAVVRPHGAPRPLVDLPLAARRSLEAAGLGPERIEVVGLCTRCTPDRLHSYRRDGPRAGRQLGLVRLRLG